MCGSSAHGFQGYGTEYGDEGMESRVGEGDFHFQSF